MQKRESKRTYRTRKKEKLFEQLQTSQDVSFSTPQKRVLKKKIKKFRKKTLT